MSDSNHPSMIDEVDAVVRVVLQQEAVLSEGREAAIWRAAQDQYLTAMLALGVKTYDFGTVHRNAGEWADMTVHEYRRRCNGDEADG